MKLSWGSDEQFEGVIIQVGYHPVNLALLVTNDYLNCQYQVWKENFLFDKDSTLRDLFLPGVKIIS